MNIRLSFFLILALNTRLCFGESEQTQLDKINLAVAQEEHRLELVANEYEKIQSALKQLEVKLSSMRTEERKIEDSFVKVSNDKSNLEKQIAATEVEIVALKVLGLKRIRALYMKRSEGILQTLFVTSDSSSLSRNAFYLAKIQNFDRALLEKYNNLVSKSLEDKRKLELVQKEFEGLRINLQKKRQNIELERGRQKVLLKQSEEERNKIEVSLTELRASALRLETVMSSLTGGEELEIKKIPIKKRSSEVIDDYEGPGLIGSNLRLVAPIKGRLVPQSTSKQGLDQFLSKKGVEFEVAPGVEVKAIAPGRTIYSGKMPGFGNLLIIDHGKRWYSVYGRLGQILIQKGDDVQSGEEIALSASEGERERNFYFEIRHNGSAVNPSRLGRFMTQ